MTLSLLLACASGTVVLTDPAETGETGDPGNGDPGEEEEEAPSYEGDYDAWLVMHVPTWDWDMCEGEVALEIDAEGNLDYDGECWSTEADWNWSVEVWGDGSVDGEGEIAGTAVFEWWDRDEAVELEGELSGSVTEDGDLELEYEVEDVSFGRGEEEDVVGWIGTE